MEISDTWLAMTTTLSYLLPVSLKHTLFEHPGGKDLEHAATFFHALIVRDDLFLIFIVLVLFGYEERLALSMQKAL